MVAARHAAAALALALLAAGGAAAETLPPGQVRALAAGKVLTAYWKLRGSNIGTGKATGVIDASPEQVLAVVSDVARFKEYMYRVVDSRLRRRKGRFYYFYYRIDMPWPFSDHWCETKNWHTVDRKRRRYVRHWKLVSGTFRRNDGSWTLRPWPLGADPRSKSLRTLATYSVVLQLKSMVPQVVVNFATKKALPRAVRALRKRVLSLKARGALRAAH